PTPARDRRADGLRRAKERRAGARGRRRTAADAGRGSDRIDRGIGTDALSVEPALRGQADRSADLCCHPVGSRSRCALCLLAARAARCENRTDGGAAVRMTNDEFPMTKEFLSPNDEGKPANWPGRFGHSWFDLLSTFVIRVSS